LEGFSSTVTSTAKTGTSALQRPETQRSVVWTTQTKDSPILPPPPKRNTPEIGDRENMVKVAFLFFVNTGKDKLQLWFTIITLIKI
jgi:hypothetical protein